METKSVMKDYHSWSNQIVLHNYSVLVLVIWYFKEGGNGITAFGLTALLSERFAKVKLLYLRTIV